MSYTKSFLVLFGAFAIGLFLVSQFASAQNNAADETIEIPAEVVANTDLTIYGSSSSDGCSSGEREEERDVEELSERDERNESREEGDGCNEEEKDEEDESDEEEEGGEEEDEY